MRSRFSFSQTPQQEQAKHKVLSLDGLELRQYVVAPFKLLSQQQRTPSHIQITLPCIIHRQATFVKVEGRLLSKDIESSVLGGLGSCVLDEQESFCSPS